VRLEKTALGARSLVALVGSSTAIGSAASGAGRRGRHAGLQQVRAERHLLVDLGTGEEMGLSSTVMQGSRS
jgi:hypothetical protein